MGERKRWQIGHGNGRSARVLSRLAALALGALGIGSSTCGEVDSVLDYCDTNEECTNWAGSVCMDGICTCANWGDEFCDGACRPSAECSPIGMGGAGGAGGLSSTGGAGGVECTIASDCKQPGDWHCGQATCNNGVCGLDLTPFSKLKSQIRGDCKNLWCDGAGNLIEIEDGSETYDDGAECTTNLCQAGQPYVMPYPNMSTCPKTKMGVCYDNSCVECIADLVPCGGGLVCDGVRCVAQFCVNDDWDSNFGETAKNCGGPCRPCDEGQACVKTSDCLSDVCIGVCQAPTNSDGVQNGDETGVDCGGPSNIPRCDDIQGCKVGSDCLSNVCWAGVCQPPQCDDGIKNGNETDWDCGGSCPPCP